MSHLRIFVTRFEMEQGSTDALEDGCYTADAAPEWLSPVPITDEELAALEASRASSHIPPTAGSRFRRARGSDQVVDLRHGWYRGT